MLFFDVFLEEGYSVWDGLLLQCISGSIEEYSGCDVMNFDPESGETKTFGDVMVLVAWILSLLLSISYSCGSPAARDTRKIRWTLGLHGVVLASSCIWLLLREGYPGLCFVGFIAAFCCDWVAYRKASVNENEVTTANRAQPGTHLASERARSAKHQFAITTHSPGKSSDDPEQPPPHYEKSVPFASDAGKSLVNSFCTKCGVKRNTLAVKDLFCGKCGAKF